MSQDENFEKRVADIRKKKQYAPAAPPRAKPPNRTEFQSSMPRDPLLGRVFYSLFTPARLIGIVGFGVIAVMTLHTAGTFDSAPMAQNHVMDHNAASSAPQAVDPKVKCVEIHHPLDLIRHNNNPATASIPVCDITKNTHHHN